MVPAGDLVVLLFDHFMTTAIDLSLNDAYSVDKVIALAGVLCQLPHHMYNTHTRKGCSLDRHPQLEAIFWSMVAVGWLSGARGIQLSKITVTPHHQALQSSVPAVS
jgi:hypothetical protein